MQLRVHTHVQMRSAQPRWEQTTGESIRNMVQTSFFWCGRAALRVGAIVVTNSWVYGLQLRRLKWHKGYTVTFYDSTSESMTVTEY